jgi:CheY-like chemotaxis protein/two-component sensor histidine kinase
MDRQLRHLLRLVDDLLEMSRISRGLVKIQTDVVDLASVLRTAVDTSRPLIDRAGHTLQVELPDEPIAVSGDAVRLTQVFANLLTNAAKYTSDGGRIWLHATREGSRVVVSVRDNGIGISPSHLGTVFDMFVQVDRSDRLSQGGLGIGLTLVKTLVRLHGGRVEARSEGVGTGSEFVVELPLVAEPVTAAGSNWALAPLPSRNVLIVDDNHDAADTLATLLRSLGVTVAVAHSGAEALAQMPLFRPDAAILDIGMPEIDGYALARLIRADARSRDVLLIALTGWGQDHDVRRAYEAGFDHHLVKPPDLDKLRRWLGERLPSDASRSTPVR